MGTSPIRFFIFLLRLDLRPAAAVRMKHMPDGAYQIKTVNQHVHNGCHNESGGDVKDGMLFDEHGGKDNGYAKDGRTDADVFFIFQMFALHNGNVRTQGIVNMDAGPEVGRRICLIQGSHHSGENIVSGHYIRS